MHCLDVNKIMSIRFECSKRSYKKKIIDQPISYVVVHCEVMTMYAIYYKL